ncbi:MAG TPA: hypothetical protein VIF60_16935, partial [Burkholderiaceae bacterium]
LFLLLATLGNAAMAVGLGELVAKSALGQPLLATVGLVNTGGEIENRCFKASLNTIDGNRLGNISLSVHNADATLYMSTRESVNEPAVVLTVEYVCSSQTRRDYQILLDLQPPANLPSISSQANAANVSQAASSTGVGVSSRPSAASDAAPAPRKSRRHRPDTEVVPAKPIATIQTAPVRAGESPAQEKRRAKNSAKALRNVLHLGSDPSVDDSLNGVEGMRLALSHGLRGENADLDVQPAVPAPAADAATAAATAATAASAAPAVQPLASANDLALKELQAKIQRLETQTEELKQLNAKHVADLAAAEKEKESHGSLVYLYFLLLASFVAIGWLLWRTRQIQAGINHSWEEIVPEHEENSVPEQRTVLQQEADDFLDQPIAKPEVRLVTPLKPQFRQIVDEDVAPPAPKQDDFVSTLVLPRAPEQEPVEGDYKFTGNIRSALPDAEEILDEIQQAEFWMDMQQPQRAIEILESNWGAERPSSPLPWLYLFDLYRMVGNKEKYLELTERFERIFNGKVIAWEDGELLQKSRSLEDFPVLLKKITQLWGTADLVPFMENLLIDDRDGRRQGFDLSAYRDILFLTNIAYEIQDSTEFSKASHAPEWSVIK